MKQVMNHWRPALLVAATFLTFIASVAHARYALAKTSSKSEADFLIVNAKLIDGSGGPWRQGDIAVTGDRISYIGNVPIKAKKIIDAKGKVASPGFIDMHEHSEYGLSLDGRGLSMVTQGVTTAVLGEHLSAGPVLGPAVDDPMMVAPPVKRTWTTLGGFFDFLTKKGIGLNVASYVGAGQVRASVIGYENRAPTSAEMSRMKSLVAQAMREGAFGLSAGLDYVPNSYAATPELIELAKTASEMGGIYAVHLRATGGANALLARAAGVDPNANLLETLEISRAAHIPVEMFHVGMRVARDPKFVKMVEQARDEGLDITANAYPYTVGWTYVRQLIPVWAQEGDSAAITARLQDPKVRARVVAEMTAQSQGRYGNWTISSADLQFDGRTFQQVADARHETVEEAMIDFLVAEKGNGFQIGPSDSSMDQAEAESFRYNWLDVGSDGIALPVGVHTAFGRPHPRSFGTFTRMLGDVVRKRHILTLEQAVKKMSSQPANRLGLADRGLLRQGMKADIVIFDPDTVGDTATYAQPESYSKGISWVFVNGRPVVAEGKPTNALPGRILHGPAYVPGTL